MKLTSVIFLIVAVVLTFTGFFICKYARGLAPNDAAIDGETIKDGQIENEIEYSDQNVSRISMDLADCTLTIHGGAKSSYVKLKNFEPNKYIGSISKKCLTVSNNISITDYLNLDGSGASFAGVWRTLRSAILSDDITDSSVDLYISDEEEIKQISLTLSNVTLRIVGVTQKCDISISADKSSMEFNNLTPSALKIDGDKNTISLLSVVTDKLSFEMDSAEINMRDLSADSISLTLGEADTKIYETKFTTFSMSLKKGDTEISTANAKSNFKRSIVTESGEIKVGKVGDGDLESIGLSDTETNDNLPGSIDIDIESGDLIIRYGDDTITPETSDTPSTAAGN